MQKISGKRTKQLKKYKKNEKKIEKRNLKREHNIYTKI